MTDVSTKKTIEVWDGETGLHFIVSANELECIVIERKHGDGLVFITVPVEMSGQLNRAIIEIAHNIAENTRDDDGES